MKVLLGILFWLATANLMAAGIGLNSTGIDMGSNPISNLAEPLIPGDAATKNYVDSNTDVRIPISNAGFVIDSPGSYYLAGDIEAIGTSGVIVGAINVSIDLMGYSILGDGSANFGIEFLINRHTATIRDGRVSGFGKSGIYGPGSNNFITIDNVSVKSNGSAGSGSEIYSGIHLGGQVTVTNCSIAYNGHDGINLNERSRIINNHVTGNGNLGVVLAGLENFVAENTVLRSGSVGIQVVGGYIVDNLVAFNDGNGIQVLATSRISGNQVKRNTGSGIEAGSGSQIRDNLVAGNTLNGILASSSSVIANMIYDNNTSGGVFLAGLYIDGRSRVSDNTITANENNNIYVKSSGNVIIENNYLSISTYGIRFGNTFGSAFRDNTFDAHLSSAVFNVGTNVDDGGNLEF